MSNKIVLARAVGRISKKFNFKSNVGLKNINTKATAKILEKKGNNLIHL